MSGARGKIVDYADGRGTVRLDDGSQLVFFRFSCGFEPAAGMKVFVWETAPFHEGGLRATALSDSPRVKAKPGDYARTIDATTRARLKDEERRAARRQKRLAAEAARQRQFVAQHPAPRKPRLSSLLPTTGWPASAHALVKRREAALRSAVALEFFDPGTVPLGSGSYLHVGLVAHPELAAQLVCWERHDVVDTPRLELVGVRPLSKANQVLSALRDLSEANPHEVDQQLRALFSAPPAEFTARSDHSLLLSWGLAPSARRLAAGKKLLAHYEAKRWKVLARRLDWQLRRDDYARRYARAVYR